MVVEVEGLTQVRHNPGRHECVAPPSAVLHARALAALPPSPPRMPGSRSTCACDQCPTLHRCRDERDYVVQEDFMKAVRKLAEAKKLESPSPFSSDFGDKK